MKQDSPQKWGTTCKAEFSNSANTPTSVSSPPKQQARKMKKMISTILKPHFPSYWILSLPPRQLNFSNSPSTSFCLTTNPTAFPYSKPPFNIALAFWTDILGATMLGKKPVFADAYWEKLIAHVSSDLLSLWNSKIRLSIWSLIACLESSKL